MTIKTKIFVVGLQCEPDGVWNEEEGFENFKVNDYGVSCYVKDFKLRALFDVSKKTDINDSDLFTNELLEAQLFKDMDEAKRVAKTVTLSCDIQQCEVFQVFEISLHSNEKEVTKYYIRYESKSSEGNGYDYFSHGEYKFSHTDKEVYVYFSKQTALTLAEQLNNIREGHEVVSEYDIEAEQNND